MTENLAVPPHIMKHVRALSIGFAALLVGSFLSTAMAMTDDTSASCDALKGMLEHLRPGTSTYQRTILTIKQQCDTIRPGCPSEISLQAAEKRCGLDQKPMRYRDASQCVQVSCSDTIPFEKSSSSEYSYAASSSAGVCQSGDALFRQALASKSANKKFNNVIVNGCHVVQCIDDVPSQTSCPAPEELQKKARACQAIGQKYDYFTTGVCKMIRCNNESIDSTAVSCPNNDAVNTSALRCKKQSLNAKIILDKNGCRSVQCGTVSTSNRYGCPTDDQLDQAIRVCKNSGMGSTTIPDDNGCRQVLCQMPDVRSGIDSAGASAEPQNNRCAANPMALVCRVQSKSKR